MNPSFGGDTNIPRSTLVGGVSDVVSYNSRTAPRQVAFSRMLAAATAVLALAAANGDADDGLSVAAATSCVLAPRLAGNDRQQHSKRRGAPHHTCTQSGTQSAS
jgi:hypothetical protein